MAPLPLFAGFALALGLGFFLGFAFEDFYDRAKEARPGGVRTFPLLALIGALLHQLDPAHEAGVCVGLVVVGVWLAIFYARRIGEKDLEGGPAVGLMVPVCNVLAYLIGPMALSEPAWVAIGATVAGVLFLTEREQLHGYARRIEVGEVVTAGKFLMLTGLILPVLPNHPVTTLTAITPRQVWLAVIAVSAVSYASYLLQRFVLPKSAGLVTAFLGGLYSSTVTTVVLAKRARAETGAARDAQTGIVLATAVMYLRLLAVVAIFNRTLALHLAPPLAALSLVGFLMAGAWYWLKRDQKRSTATATFAPNPLEFGTAALFAGLFIVIAVAVGWVRAHLGAGGFYTLAAIVGVSDIDPFVLNIAEGGGANDPGGAALSMTADVAAILIAASSNNILKAVYAASIVGRKAAGPPVTALVILAVAGVGIALAMALSFEPKME